MKNFLRGVAVGFSLMGIVGLAFACSPAAEKGEGPSAELKKTVETFLDAVQKEELDRALSAVHKESPAYEPTKKLSEQLFGRYDLAYSLLHFRYIGDDGEYAVARVKQETKKVAGEEFADTVADTIHVFRKEGDAWKIWQTAMLEVDRAK